MEVYFGLLIIITIVVEVLRRIRLYFSPVKINPIIGQQNRKQLSKARENGLIAFTIAFIILASFSALREGIGSDYYSYWKHIQIIQRGQPNYMEFGFQRLVTLLATIDSNPRLVLIVMSIVTCYFYTKAIWDQSDDVTISVFIFLSWGYYFFTLTTVRNYFALSLVLFASKYLQKKQFLPFLLLVVLAATFHKTALICIPIYLLARKKFEKKHIIILIGIIVALIIFRTQMRTIVFRFYPRYEGSVYDDGSISYLNILKAGIIIILSILYWKHIKDDENNRFYCNLNVFSLVFYLGMYWIPEASRIGFYMNATCIFFVPRIINSLNSNRDKLYLKLILGAGSLILFYILCNGFAGPTIRLLPYRTWLETGY